MQLDNGQNHQLELQAWMNSTVIRRYTETYIIATTDCPDYRYCAYPLQCLLRGVWHVSSLLKCSLSIHFYWWVELVCYDRGMSIPIFCVCYDRQAGFPWKKIHQIVNKIVVLSPFPLFHPSYYIDQLLLNFWTFLFFVRNKNYYKLWLFKIPV